MFSWKGDGRSPSLLSPWSQFTQPATQKTLTGNSCRCFAQARRCAARKAKKRAALSADGAFQSKSSFSFVELSVSLFSIFSIPLKESKTPNAKKTKSFPSPPYDSSSPKLARFDQFLFNYKQNAHGTQDCKREVIGPRPLLFK